MPNEVPRVAESGTKSARYGPGVIVDVLAVKDTFRSASACTSLDYSLHARNQSLDIQNIHLHTHPSVPMLHG